MSILDELEELGFKPTKATKKQLQKFLRTRSATLRAKRGVLEEQIQLFVRQHRKKETGKWDSRRNMEIFIGGMKRLNSVDKKIRRVSRAPIPAFDPYD